MKLRIWSHANLRSALANLGLLAGFLAGFAIATGEADGWQLPPTAVGALAAAAAAGYYLAQRHPRLATGMLWASLALTAVGATWYVITAALFGG